MNGEEFERRQQEILDNTVDPRFHSVVRNTVMEMSRDDDDYEDMLRQSQALAEEIQQALVKYVIAKKL